MGTPLTRYAQALGFTLTAGRKHWHATHPEGGRAVVPFGRKVSVRSFRNVQASLRRASRPQLMGVA